jgi:hypothetical protein
MKKVWKWMLGILIGLVVIAVVLGAGYIVARGAGTVRWKRESRLAQRGNVEQGAPWQTKPRQRMPGQNNPGQNGPGQNGLSQNEPWNFGRNGMPMYYSGGMGFHPFGGMMLVGRLVGGVFQLALLGLVIFWRCGRNSSSSL